MSLTLADKRKRAHAIGSSEAWKIVLRQNIHDVFLRLVHPELLVPEDLESSVLGRRGHYLEPFAAELYAERMGVELVTSKTLRHPRHRFVVSTPDRLVLSKEIARRDDGSPMPPRVERNVQIKALTFRAVKRDGWGDEGTEAYPLKFRIQTTIEAAVIGAVYGHEPPPSDLVALVDGETQVRIYPVPFDGDLAKLIIDELEAFYRNHVLTRDPPAPDGSASAAAYLAKRYPENKGDLLAATADDDALGGELRHIRQQVKTLEARDAEIVNTLKARIGDHDGIEKIATWTLPKTGKGRTEWKAACEDLRAENGRLRTQLAKLPGHDAADLRDAWPELVAAHTSPPTRIFRVIGSKETP